MTYEQWVEWRDDHYGAPGPDGACAIVPEYFSDFTPAMWQHYDTDMAAGTLKLPDDDYY